VMCPAGISRSPMPMPLGAARVTASVTSCAPTSTTPTRGRPQMMRTLRLIRHPPSR
jgi:hypothetical protein